MRDDHGSSAEVADTHRDADGSVVALREALSGLLAFTGMFTPEQLADAMWCVHGDELVNTSEVANKFDKAQAAAWTALAHQPPVSPAEQVGGDDEEEAYQIGKRDGYEEAIQDLDLATGGDGEYKATTHEGVIDMPVMKARIIERFSVLPTPPAEGSGR